MCVCPAPYENIHRHRYSLIPHFCTLRLQYTLYTYTYYEEEDEDDDGNSNIDDDNKEQEDNNKEQKDNNSNNKNIHCNYSFPVAVVSKTYN